MLLLQRVEKAFCLVCHEYVCMEGGCLHAAVSVHEYGEAAVTWSSLHAMDCEDLAITLSPLQLRALAITTM